MLQTRNNNQMVVHKKKKKSNWRGVVNALVDPNQLAYDFGLGAIRGISDLGKQAYAGIVSAFQSKGASKAEIRALVAPLAKSLSYTSRKPKFAKAEGGLMIEHIENIGLVHSGHTELLVTSSLFQWLKGIADQFEEYQIKTWYAWNPICPATTSGQVLLAFDYDPDDTGLSQYEQATDYFNTADHCISAIWAPAAISPQRSSWLKTGTAGDLRLISPGRLHVSTTDYTAGYLTVKYQVSLRKPQPNNVDGSVIYTGVSSTTTDVFAGSTLVTGDPSLVASMSSTVLTLAPTPGYKLIVWSTDANVASFTYVTGSGGRTMGSRTGVGATYVACANPGASTTVMITNSVTPVPPIAWRLTITQVSYNPLGFVWS